MEQNNSIIDKVFDNDKTPLSSINAFQNKEVSSLGEYLEAYKTKILQDSERIFVSEFLYPILNKKIRYVIPQYPFIDSEGRSRRIDFGLVYNNKKVALEVNGETYHAEGIIPGEQFDDNLNRQNEILSAGWKLLRFSYNQLKDPIWRTKVSHDLFTLIRKNIPELLSLDSISPNPLQIKVLDSLNYYRDKGYKKGIVILPTGTGKTYLSAFDTLNAKGRVLFIVHKLDILSQSKESYEHLYPTSKLGLLTGETKENVHNSKVLFASKDSLRNCLADFKSDEFDYIVIDEVHHGQAPTYQTILQYFKPGFFMLGLTATPDRMDRKDIFELFDYNKVFEYTLNDAIDNGWLVPYTYYGLTDNVDYNNIRYQGYKYKIEDLNRELIIPERNDRIFDEYIAKGEGNKALGFCCSIKHANAMAKLFNSKGVPSISITSETPNREAEIKAFRNNEYAVAFTVDLFNEGIDFPDLRVLLFLRPTESKTIFQQQLGRGLRLCGGKGNVVVIDFIGNYRKANNIRQYLSTGHTEQRDPKTNIITKVEYEYSPKCKVIFDSEVEQILDNQDKQERDITKDDLIAAYWDLSETLKRKPSQDDINSKGEYKVSKYIVLFGSWSLFLREIGELTEFSYHFPQGTHLGHILYILNVVGSNSIIGSHIDSQYVRFIGNYDRGIMGNYQRQTKYKLQAAMEMGILVDYRNTNDNNFSIVLTPEGQLLYDNLKPLLSNLDLSFNEGGKTEISWSMNCESVINQSIHSFLVANNEAKIVMTNIFLHMDAVNLLLKYIYSVGRKKNFTKSEIYNDFFNAPFVKEYLDIHGLDIPTAEVICRRLPFLFNILESLGIIKQDRSNITVQYFIVSTKTIRLNVDETEKEISDRIMKFKQGKLEENELSELKEIYGATFGTSDYYLDII